MRLDYVSPGRVVTVEDLEAAGFLAAKPTPVLRFERPRSAPNVRATWPDYNYYVARAPRREDGSPNMNSADESYCIRCLSLGFSRYEVGQSLRSLRDKAARRGDYVERTLNAAEDWLATHAGSGRERIAI